MYVTFDVPRHAAWNPPLMIGADWSNGAAGACVENAALQQGRQDRPGNGRKEAQQLVREVKKCLLDYSGVSR